MRVKYNKVLYNCVVILDFVLPGIILINRNFVVGMHKESYILFLFLHTRITRKYQMHLSRHPLLPLQSRQLSLVLYYHFPRQLSHLFHH